MRPLGPILAILAVLVTTAGCGMVGDVPVPGSSCANVPSSVCTIQVQAAANAVGGRLLDVEVVCTAPVCDRAHGAGTATVTREDGTQVTRNWSYVGDPGPVPVPVCIGIAADVCRLQVNSALGDVRIDKHLVGIKVSCVGQCTAESGAIDIEYTFGDGTSDTVGSAWQ